MGRVDDMTHTRSTRLHHSLKNCRRIRLLCVVTSLLLATWCAVAPTSDGEQTKTYNTRAAGSTDNAINLLHIAGFIRIWPTHRPGGMQSHAFDLYSGLAGVGHRVQVFTSRHPKYGPYTREIDGRLTVHYCPLGEPEAYSSEYFHCTLEMYRSQGPFDIIHTESSAARRLVGESMIPVVVTWHGYGYEAWRSELNALYVAGALKTIQGVHVEFADEYKMMREYQNHVAISHQAAADLEDVMHIPEQRVNMILNGIDISRFEPSDAEKSRFRDRHKIPKNGLVLGVGGKLTTMKGSQLLREIAPDLIKYESFPIYFLVAGVGEQLQGWEQLGKDFPSRVLVQGTLDTSGMVLFYQAIDIFVNPTSYYQGLDLTMQEAMACGVPIIASRTGSIERTIMSVSSGPSPGQTFALGDAHALRRTILELGNDREMLATQSAASRFKAVTEFGLSRMISEYQTLFQRLLDECGTNVLDNCSRSFGFIEKVPQTVDIKMDTFEGGVPVPAVHDVVQHVMNIANASQASEKYVICGDNSSLSMLLLNSSDAQHNVRYIEYFAFDTTQATDDQVSRCDLIFHYAVESHTSAMEMPEIATLNRSMKCDATVVHVHVKNRREWFTNLYSSTFHTISCSLDVSKDLHWCILTTKSPKCESSNSWTEPTDAESREDGEYIWSIGIFSVFPNASVARSVHGDKSALSGRHIIDVEGEYMADPFVVRHQETFLMFFEVWNTEDKRGSIGLASSDDGVSWMYERIILRESFHLSYPYVFEEAGHYFMIPETHAVGQVRLYHSPTFPFVWKLHKVLLNEDLCDASIVKHEGMWYIFASPPSNDRVLLYYSGNLLGVWQEHLASPVLVGKEHGRPAGSIIKIAPTSSSSTGLILFVQDCSGSYGAGVNSFQINELSATRASIVPRNDTGLYGSGVPSQWNKNGMHHVSMFSGIQGELLAAVDGWRLRPKNFEFT